MAATRVALDERVDVGQRGRHPTGERGVARRDLQRVDPDTLWATRWSRAICSASTAGSPRSHPSERITTIAPRAMPRSPHCVVELPQPVAEAGAAAPVDAPARPPGAARRRGRGVDSSRVMRVSRVPSANASTFWRPATAAWTNRSSARAYGSIDPLTSSSSTSRRLRGRRLAPVAADRLAARLSSPPAPCGAGRVGPCAAGGRRSRQRPAGRADEPQAASSAAGPRSARRRRSRRSPCAAAPRWR